MERPLDRIETPVHERTAIDRSQPAGDKRQDAVIELQVLVKQLLPVVCGNVCC
jgi:hypothetical protein